MEALVREYFSDIPVMIEVARCESEFKHYSADGTVRKNAQGSSATGLMQVMASIHRKPAAALGFDIDTPEGNMAYARHLYESSGLVPWFASKHCWNSPKAANRWKAATETLKKSVVAEADEIVSDDESTAQDDIATIKEMHTQLVKMLETITQIQAQRVATIAS